MNDLLPSEENNASDKYRGMMPDYSQEYTDKDYRVGFGRRLGAFLLDTLYLMLLSGVVSLFFLDFSQFQAFAGTDIKEIIELSENIAQVLVPVQVVLTLLYYSLEIFVGASLGKMTLNIVIADKDRFAADKSKLLSRYLIKHISTIFSGIAFVTSISFIGSLGSFLYFILVVGFFWTLSENKQAFHDMLTKTAVYYKDELKNTQSI